MHTGAAALPSQVYPIPSSHIHHGSFHSSPTRSIPSPRSCARWLMLQSRLDGPFTVLALAAGCCSLTQVDTVHTLSWLSCVLVEAVAWPRKTWLRPSPNSAEECYSLAWPGLFLVQATVLPSGKSGLAWHFIKFSHQACASMHRSSAWHAPCSWPLLVPAGTEA